MCLERGGLLSVPAIHVWPKNVETTAGSAGTFSPVSNSSLDLRHSSIDVRYTRLQCEECCSRNQIPGLLVSKWNKDYSHLFDEFHAIGESSQVDNLPSASAVPFSLHFPFSLNPSNA